MTPMEDLKRRAGTIAGDSFTTEIDTDTLQWAVAAIERLTAENERLWSVNDRLRDLVRTLIEEDPNADAADGGVTVLDVWRKCAIATLGYQQQTMTEKT